MTKGRLSAAEIERLRAKRAAALRAKSTLKALPRKKIKGLKRPTKAEKTKLAKLAKHPERKRVMAEQQKVTPGVAHTGAKVAAHKEAEPNIGQPEIRMKEAPEGKRTELGKGLREHVEGIMKKHEAGDPNLPSPTEVTVRALGLRVLQLLAEADALAAQLELYEVPEEDEAKRAEAKKNASKVKEKV